MIFQPWIFSKAQNGGMGPGFPFLWGQAPRNSRGEDVKNSAVDAVGVRWIGCQAWYDNNVSNVSKPIMSVNQ